MNAKGVDNIMDDPVIQKELAEYGLKPEVLAQHQRNIRSYLANAGGRFFPIVDTCRIDNGGILKLPADPGSMSGEGIVAFVPAAGASTRYVAPLSPLISAIERGSKVECRQAVAALRSSGLASGPLPETLVRFLVNLEQKQFNGHDEANLKALIYDIQAPKALYPAVDSGETFLEIKRIEHRAMKGIIGEVYIAPPGQTEKFLEKARAVASPIPMACYEQGVSLSTLRFDGAGLVVRTANNRLSLVPGGHGTLMRLFGHVARDFPLARGIFIRNIDNVSGTRKDVIAHSERFLSAFKASLEKINRIRASMRNEHFSVAEDTARELVKFWGIAESADPLQRIMTDLFHVSPKDRHDLLAQMDKPFVLMGQVPNTGRDVGGTCVMARVDGRVQKLCLELPHASPQDRQMFLEDPNKSTHFNPVFVAAEIPDLNVLNRLEDNPFWLVSKKLYRGHDVYYQESILYEILGSSQYTNVVFTEIPRILFNPHKTLQDALNKRISDWMP